MEQQPPVGQGFPIIEASRSHSDTPDSVRTSGLVISPTQRPLPDNTHKRQASMPPEGFEPAIPASKWQQTHVLDRTATGFGQITVAVFIFVQNIIGQTTWK
jgi:hypothetical protein